MKPAKKPAKPSNGKATSDKPVPDGNKTLFNALLRQASLDKPATTGRGKGGRAST